MPTRRLFEVDDSVIIEINDKKRKATIAEYDAKGRKVIVKYDGNKKIEDSWISTKHVTRVDAKGKPIATPRSRSRSGSRGRTPAKKSNSPARSASRTRSSSRSRKPKANSAEFSSADEAALAEPTPVKVRKSPARKKATKTPAKAKAPAKDAQFSADDEPDHSTPAKGKGGKSKNQIAIEKNSKDVAEKPAAAAKKQECKWNVLKLNLCGFCPGMFVCDLWKKLVCFAFWMFNMLVMIGKLTINNLPMVLAWYIANASIFFLMDKKNVRLAHFHKDNFQLPSFPFNFDFIMNMKLMSYDFNVWKANVLMLWNVLEYPFYLYFLCMGKIDVLQNYFNGAKMIVGNSPRVYSKVNLRKVWLSQILIAGFIIYFDSLLAIIDQYYPAILTNPVTPHLRSLCLWLNGKFYNILTAVFLNSKKYYFSLILLAAFQAYSDHDFDVTTKFQDWFLNSDGTTGLKTRFVYTYGFEMASHLAFLVLAVKNPTNRWLWLLVNANFLQGFLATRSSESHDGQTIEANTLKRHYQGTLISGFWFYFMQIYKMFTVMSFWRFINKTKTMTNCQCQLYFFGAAFLASHILKYQSGAHYPSEKRHGINGKIRNANILSEILYVLSLVLLCDFKFGNAPFVMFGVYVFLQILDLKIAEACALQKSRTKWAAYHAKVPYRFIPRVW